MKMSEENEIRSAMVNSKCPEKNVKKEAQRNF